MSEELIKSLNARLSQLEQDKANLRTALKQEREKSKAVSAERDEFAEALTGLSSERDELAQRADAQPTDLTNRIKELEGALAGRDHRDAFRDHALKAGVKPDAVGDLYNLSGLKPGEQPARAEDFAAFLTAAKEARSWAFGEASPAGGSSGANGASTTTNGAAANGSQATQGLAQAAQATGSGRGGPDTSAARVQYSLTEVAKPGWQASRPELLAALAKGEAVCVGE